MDGGGLMNNYYGFRHSEEYYEFHNTMLAPPQGNFAKTMQDFAITKAMQANTVLHGQHLD